METVIAIGIVGILLTTFIGVFGPATRTIRKSINAQEANRLARALELELTTLRADEQTAAVKTAFDKAFGIIKEGQNTRKGLLAFQYRASTGSTTAGTLPRPYGASSGGDPGRDFIVTPIVFPVDDPPFTLTDLLEAAEGRIYYARLTQLVERGGSLVNGDAGQIIDSTTDAPADDADTYRDAVIAFRADFYDLPTKAVGFFPSGMETFLQDKIINPGVNVEPISPIFSRNMAVRR